MRNIETKELAKDHIDSIINYMITYPVGESNTKLICIYSVMIKVFRLGLIGTVAPGLEKFVQNKFLVKSLVDDNLCWDFCGTMFTEPDLKDRHRNTCTKVNAYKRIMRKDPPKNYKGDFLTFTKDYKGFDITNKDELKYYCDYYKCNINLYSFSESKDRYKLDNEYRFNDEYKIMHILLVLLKNNKIHAMLIKNEEFVEKLTGFRFCPKCKDVISRRDKNRNDERDYNKHVEECDGTFKRKCRLDKKQKPYIPHIFKNKAYFRCLQYGVEYEPIRYYMTYDFETMQIIANEEITEKTTLYSKHVQLSVASTIKSRK